MSESQDITQRRRQKILSRIASQSTQEDSSTSSPSNQQSTVFDRYKILKTKQQNFKQLINLSRYSGLLIFAVSFALPPWIAFSFITLLLIGRAFSISCILWYYQEQKAQKGNQFSWIEKIVPFLGKLTYLDRVILVAKVTANSILSYLMSTVLLNAVFLLLQSHLNPNPTPSIQLEL